MAKRIWQKRIMTLPCLLAAVSCCGLIYGIVAMGVTSIFATGIVDISLTEYQLKDGKEEAWEDNPLILPGDEISKIPRIHNHGVDCYVRAKITILPADNLPEGALDGIEIAGMDEGWQKAEDGFYYYKELLPHGADVDLFRWVRIPENLPQAETEGKLFHIHIDVEAIQDQNYASGRTEPKTGDVGPVGAYLSLMILSAGVIGCICIRYRRQESGKKEESHGEENDKLR